MSVEYTNSSGANMNMTESKIGYKQLLTDNARLRSSVSTLKENPFRTATVCLGALCILLVVGLICQSAIHSKAEQENKNKLQSVNTEKETIQTSLTSAQKRQNSLEESNRQLDHTVQQSERRREQVQSAYNSLAEDRNKLRESESTLRSANTRLTRDLQQLNATVTRLRKDNNVISAGKDLLQEKLIQVKELHDNLDKNYKNMTRDRNNLQNSLNNFIRNNENYESKYMNLVQKLSTIERELHLTSIEKDQAQSSHMNATSTNEALQIMNEILLNSTNELNVTFEKHKLAYQELEKSCESIRGEWNSLKEENGNLTAERNQLQLKIIELNTTIAAKRCPSGWQSYMFSCYYTSTVKKNWKNSRDSCKNKGGDLAVITSREEMSFINGLHSTDKEVWIGLTDDSIETQWRWVDGTALDPNATFWGSGQPNSHNGRNQDCVEFWPRATGVGEWNDESCKIEQFFICEI